MALKTDYKDAVFSGNRKYNMIANSDGTYSFADVTTYETEGDYFGAEDINETNAAINTATNATSDGSVTRVGTVSIGSNTQPIFLSNGYPTACSTTVGGTAKPVYSNAGVITACSSTVGSGTQPVYMSSGTVTACNTTVGSGTKPIYSASGVLTASSSTVGSGTQPCYLSSGTITACTTTVGSGVKPIYSSSGILTASSSTVGGSNQPVYLSSGTITACNSMVPLSGGVTMTGQLVAYNNTNYTTYQVRNIAFSTSVPSSLNNGTICMVYSS